MADIDRADTSEFSTSDKIEATRAEIEHTRGDMAETLNAIKDKLDPKALMDEAKERVEDAAANLAEKAKDTVHSVVTDVSSHAKEAAHNVVSGTVDEARHVVDNVVHSAQHKVGDVMDTARGAGSSVIDTVKRNPVPSALIALGAAWLYMKQRDEEHTARYRQWRNYGEFDYPREARMSENAGDHGADRLGQAASAVGDAASAAKDKAGEMLDSAKDAVGGAMDSAKYAGSSIIDTISSNPIPAAATAMGLVWLYLKNQDDNRGRRNGDSYGYSERYYQGGSSGGDDGNVIDQVKDKAGSAVDAVKDKAGQVGEKVGSAVDAVKEKAGQVTSQARDRAGELKSQAGTTITRTLQENPLPIGMVALGIGAALGLMVPSTDQENRMMGAARDRLVDKAQDTAHDIAEKVQTVAGQTIDAAKETAQHVARDQGLTPPSSETRYSEV